MLNYMLNSSIGFAWGVRAATLLSAVCLLAGNLLVTFPSKPPRTAQRSYPVKTMRDWPYLLTVLTGFIMLLETYFPSYFVQLFAKKHGVSKTFTFYSLALIHGASVIARIGVNAYANRFGAINLFAASCILNGFVIFGMLGCNTPVGLVLFSIFHGFFFGATVSLYLPVVVDLAPSEADLGYV
ncbi:hypothetical protein AX17_004233 [Amanita inopinata Kibby_2008]|nr:hypothetical protein AX17_004233 [Amanita inopinata Kibby_2008]